MNTCTGFQGEHSKSPETLLFQRWVSQLCTCSSLDWPTSGAFHSHRNLSSAWRREKGSLPKGFGRGWSRSLLLQREVSRVSLCSTPSDHSLLSSFPSPGQKIASRSVCLLQAYGRGYHWDIQVCSIRAGSTPMVHFKGPAALAL